MSLTKLDDRDPSVKLGSGWARPADAPQFDGTVTLSRVPGSSLTIEFTGTSISVFGSILGKTTPTSTYVIDNGEPTLFALEAQNPKTQFSQNFFQSDELPFGNHTLLVTNKGDWFYFDYFVLKTLNSLPFSQPPTNPAPTSPPSSNPPPLNPPPTNPLPPNPPPPNPPPPNLPPSNPPPNLQPPTTQSSQTVASTFLNQTILTSQAETSLQVTQSFSPSVVTITVYTSTSTQNIFSGPPNPTLSALVTSPADTNATVTRVSRLSAGAIVGIVVGVVIAAATILVLLYCCYHRRKARNRTSGLNSLRGGNFFASSPETRLVPFDGQQAARSFPRSRKNNNNSIDYVVPIETEQQRVSSGDPFREVEHGNFRI